MKPAGAAEVCEIWGEEGGGALNARIYNYIHEFQKGGGARNSPEPDSSCIIALQSMCTVSIWQAANNATLLTSR